MIEKTTEMSKTLCSACGRINPVSIVFCQMCGKALRPAPTQPLPPMPSYQPARQTGLTQGERTGYALICLLIPVAGFIMGLYYLAKEDALSRTRSRFLLIWSVLALVAWWFARSWLLGA